MANVICELEGYNITKINYFKCIDSIVNCSNQGECNKYNDDCDCFEGFITHFDKIDDFYSEKSRCNYKQKKQLYAFVLGLFISFGFVHFYLGNNLAGYTQLFLFIIIFTFNIIAIYKLSLKHIKQLNALQYKQSLSIGMIIGMFSFIFLIWYIFDIFMIIFNVYRDSNNIMMQETIPSIINN